MSNPNVSSCNNNTLGVTGTNDISYDWYNLLVEAQLAGITVSQFNRAYVSEELAEKDNHRPSRLWSMIRRIHRRQRNNYWSLKPTFKCVRSQKTKCNCSFTVYNDYSRI